MKNVILLPFFLLFLVSCNSGKNKVQQNIEAKLIEDGKVNSKAYSVIETKEKELVTDTTEIYSCYQKLYNIPVKIDFDNEAPDPADDVKDKFYSVYHEFDNEGYRKKGIFFLDSIDNVLMYELIQ